MPERRRSDTLGEERGYEGEVCEVTVAEVVERVVVKDESTEIATPAGQHRELECGVE